MSIWDIPIPRKGPILTGLEGTALPYWLLCNHAEVGAIIIAPSEERAQQIYTDLTGLGASSVGYFPADGHLPFEGVSPDPMGIGERLAFREQWSRGTSPKWLVVPVAAILGRWMPHDVFMNAITILAVGGEIERDNLGSDLLKNGYQRVDRVEDPGTYAIRGSIVDFFPPTLPHPIRVDLFGDDITSIAGFEPQTHRVLQRYEQVNLFPIREILFSADSIARAQTCLRELGDRIDIPSRQLNNMIDELGSENYFFGIEALGPAFYDHSEPILRSLLEHSSNVVFCDFDETCRTIEECLEQAETARSDALNRHEVVLNVGDYLLDTNEFAQAFAQTHCLFTATLVDDLSKETQSIAYGNFRELSSEISLRRENAAHGEILAPLVETIRSRLEGHGHFFVACHQAGNAQRLRDLLLNRHLDLPVLESFPGDMLENGPFRDARCGIVSASLTQGIEDAERGLSVITDGDIFGVQTPTGIRRRRKPHKDGLSTLKALDGGDFVIHVDHGIGRYVGLKRLIVGGVDGDYVHVEYANNDKLYLPVYRLNLLQRYRGSERNVRLDKLGGNRWEKTKQRVKDSVLEIAHQLLEVQARRDSLEGFALDPPDEAFRTFEAAFPYEETPDQLRAISEVITDLTAPCPMDRLLCGDVGFGKTEVGIRAAYLAIRSGFQVAVLVPTTVLAEQHGTTFRERLECEGVRIEVLSRFRSSSDTVEILRDCFLGHVDILIGTHRLLSHDVQYKNLGLLIVDEEQRFGVRHKERIKQLRHSVNVLTMSATPIPRTLHMAAVGLRDLSTISTPPTARNAIKTEITRFDERIISEAIRRELHRGGQIFVVHNRVSSIAALSELLRRLVPEARIAVAHGQMSGTQLEKIMVDFVRRQTNVLVCTAIIESGIDIPLANTMIIDRADMFGMSQLHQLRGRIGRGARRAYAYLLLPRTERISKEATSRLAVLKKFSDLGAGYQIATHDLDLRGPGNLLGGDQSGNIAAVGFELYTELLTEAVETVKGQTVSLAIEPDIKLPVSAVLPEDYIPQPMVRLGFYQRMTLAQSDEEIYEIRDDIKSSYGTVPPEADNLVEVMLIRRWLRILGASALSASAQESGEIKMAITFVPQAPIDRGILAEKLQTQGHRYRVTKTERLAITLNSNHNLDDAQFLRTVRGELEELYESLIQGDKELTHKSA